MSDLEKKEKENFLRHAVLVVDHCKRALISLIELSLQLKKITFEQFLNNHHHEIFHMCRERICHCGIRQRFPQVFFRPQIELLFDITLKSAKPGVVLEVLDMTLARCLLINFCSDVFWHYNLQYQGKSLKDFLNAEKHTIYHLWQYNAKCCHCPTVFNSTLNFPKLDQREWQSMFNVASPQPPCSMQAQANAFPCNSLCDYEIQPTITVSGLNERLQKTVLENCCNLRTSVEKLVNIRNFRYGHAENARMSDSDFEESKNAISTIILNIANVCGKEPEVQADLTVTLSESLDQKLVEKYKEMMSDLYQNLQQQNEWLQELEANVVETNTRIDALRSRVETTNSRFDTTDRELCRTNVRVDDTNAALGTTNARVVIIGNRVDDTNSELDKTNIRVDDLSHRVDDTNVGLQTVHTKVNEAKQHLGKVTKQVEDPVPPNIREQNSNELKEWKKKDIDFVPTRASKHILDCVTRNVCVTITGPAGCGKTFLARHTSLVLEKDEYDIIIINTPKDIRDFYKPGRKTLFIVDDICGNFAASQEKIDNWLQFKEVLGKIVEDQNCKIIVSCRLQVFRDENFKCLSHFLSCECNLVSESLCLLPEEKAAMIEKYTDEKIHTYIIKKTLGTAGAFLPLLCSLYRNTTGTSAVNFLQNPFDLMTEELDNVSNRKEDSSKYKICSLALCVLFNNNLDAGWFKGRIKTEQRSLLDELSNACKTQILSKQYLEDELKTLVETFIIKHGTVYKAIHDKVFDFLAWYFGKRITSCIIDHGDSDLIHERFRWSLEEVDNSGDLKYLIGITDEYLYQYIERMLTDWTNGKIVKVFNNINMRKREFRKHFLRYLSTQTQFNIDHLIEKKDRSYYSYYGKMQGSRALLEAMKNEYLDIFEWFLNHNESYVNQTYSMNRSLLYIASMKGKLDALCFLLNKNADVNLCDENGKSPLKVACENDNVDIISKLLEKNPDINLCDKNGRSTLWLACLGGKVEIVSKLLENDPNINLCDDNGESPLWVACLSGNVEIVSMLLEKDPDINLYNEDGKTPLWEACNNSRVEIVSKLLEKDPELNICNKYGRSSLWAACNGGNVAIVSLLLEKGPDIDLCDEDERSPLLISCINENVEIVSKLLEKNPDINLCDVDGRSPLWISCSNENIEIVSKLLEKGPDIDLCDKDGRSPLLISCSNENVEIVSMLLEKDPDINICDKGGISPLSIAYILDNIQIISILLEKDPQLNLCDEDGQSHECL